MATITKGASPNAASRDYKEFEGRTATQPIILRGGVDQETSKFAAAPGTLYDCLNYVATPSGYERIRGLRQYDGTYDQPLTNFYYIFTTQAETPTSATNDLTEGGRVTWASGSGTVIFWESLALSVQIGILDIDGDVPVAGDTLTDEATGDAVVLGNPLATAPGWAIDPEDPAASTIIPDIGDYQSSFSNLSLGLSNNSDVITATPHNTYKGAVPGLGRICGGWQFNDYVYTVRDGYPVQFENGGQNSNVPIYPGEIIRLGSATAYYFRVLYVEKTAGYWEDETAAGWMVLGPSDAPSYKTTTMRGLASQSSLGTIRTPGNTDLADLVALPYNQPANSSVGALVWKAGVTGWDFVNTGWAVDFNLGQNAPSVPDAPLFQDNIIAATRATAATLASSGAGVVSGVYTAWANASNITADDATYATCNLPALSYSDRLVANFGTSLVPTEDSKIVGLEVELQARATGAGGLPYDADVRITWDGGRVSLNKAAHTALVAGVVNYSYGGSGDLWGIDEITVADVNAADFGVELQYYNPHAVNAGQVEIDYVKVTIHYAPNKDTLYFYNGTTDVAVGDVYAYQQTAGEFISGDASGTFYVDFSADNNEVGLKNVIVGTEIWTEPLGTGLQVAVVANPPVYNLLPSAADMIEAESFYQTIKANFFENEDTEAVYGVTGASPAFAFGSSGFHFIRTPVEAGQDTPRHVAFYDNRLALGYQPGFVTLSALGVPNDFQGATGAGPSLWGVGDRVTGLLSAKANVLVVLSESSIRTIEGLGEESGTMKVLSPQSGALEYTAANVVEPLFANNQGVTTISASDKYGDFDLGQVTDKIRSWITHRTQTPPSTYALHNRPLIATTVRSKNQYRLFFEDGYVLVLHFSPDGLIEPTFLHYECYGGGDEPPAFPSSTNFVPTWVDSTVLSDGRERIVMGTEQYNTNVNCGVVFIVDGSDFMDVTFGGGDLASWIILNPVHTEQPDGLSKTLYPVLQGKFNGYEIIEAWSDTNYEFDKTGAAEDTVTIGATTDPVQLELKSEIVKPYLPTLTDGVTIKFRTSTETSMPPHTLQAVTVRQSRSGTNRNRAPKEY